MTNAYVGYRLFDQAAGNADYLMASGGRRTRSRRVRSHGDEGSISGNRHVSVDGEDPVEDDMAEPPTANESCLIDDLDSNLPG